MSKNKKTAPEPVKVRNSLARKLSSRLFFRLLGIFLSLDIMICLITGVFLIGYGERKADAAARMLKDSLSPDAAQTVQQAIPGIRVETVSSVPDGIIVPLPFSYPLPEETRTSVRSAELKEEAGAGYFDRLNGAVYLVYYDAGIYEYKISVALGTFFYYFRYALCVLLVYEFLVLLSRITKDRRMVTRTLDPIAELAEAAKSLNRAGSRFDPDKMAALAGKLEGINAARLDTRLQVDETQVELKNLAMAINSMLDRINEAYRAQVRFVSDASHELRTPISVIQGYANLLDRWGKNDEKTLQESINAIKDEAANMKELIEQLLFLARGDNNTITLQLEKFSLKDLAEEVVNETRMIDTTHRFEVRSSEVCVNADRALIKQALRILVDNAIKYTDAGGTITVATGREGELAKLSVTDDGIGISPEIVPQIFDRFYRADESRARATGGAGLGLSIAKWIVSRHGGHMEVLSREGIGTKIVIVLTDCGAEEKTEEQ